MARIAASSWATDAAGVAAAWPLSARGRWMGRGPWRTVALLVAAVCVVGLLAIFEPLPLAACYGFCGRTPAAGKASVTDCGGAERAGLTLKLRRQRWSGEGLGFTFL